MRIAYIASGLVLCAFHSIGAAQTFQGLGHLPGGGFESRALSVSGDGQAVVGFSDSGLGTEAFLWTPEGGMIGLGDLPGAPFYSEAYAVSSDGSTVVGLGYAGNDISAFRWTAAGGMVALSDVFAGGNLSSAYSVTANGRTVVGTSWNSAGTRYEVTRWGPSGGGEPLGDLAGGDTLSYGHGVSTNGLADGLTIVGLGTTEAGSEAFRWTAAGGMVGLGSLATDTWSAARAVSADGRAVVGLSGENNTPSATAFLWTQAGGMISLGDLAGATVYSEAYAVTADGSIVVGYGTTAQGLSAFVWDAANGMRNLRDVLVNDYGLGIQLTGWTLQQARGISSDGLTIVGFGTNPNGRLEAWRAQLCGDRDGDGLCDSWETDGIDVNGDSIIDLNLPALGADPDHKDLFIEVDAMTGLAPSTAALDLVTQSFAAAPADLVNNPDGLPGIAVHILLDETDIPAAPWPNAWAGFDGVKGLRFGTAADRASPNWEFIRTARALAYRYCIFAESFGGGSSSGMGELPGNDFMVTLGHPDWIDARDNDPFVQPRWTQFVAGTVMHELGHTLGLFHGGGQIDPHDDRRYNRKPNYHSVMSYTWQLPVQSYAGGWILDYSREAFPDMVESNGLSEPDGIGAPADPDNDHSVHRVPCEWNALGQPTRNVWEIGPVNWDRVGLATDVGVSRDVNGSGTLDTLTGHEDWSKLYFHRNINWADGVHVLVAGGAEHLEEMTYQLWEAANSFLPGDLDSDGDLDADDWAIMALCIAGPDVAIPPAVCHPDQFAASDLSGDGDVDLDDCAVLQELVAP